MQKYHLLFVPEAASAAVGKSIEGSTLVCLIVGTAHALVVVALAVAVLDDDDAGINTGGVVEVMSDDLFILSVISGSCFFSCCCEDFSVSVCCCCWEIEGELEVEPQPWDVAGEDTGTSEPTACSLFKLGKFIGRGADILLASNLWRACELRLPLKRVELFDFYIM